MPSDITGTDVLEEDRATGRRVFRFVRGPLFAQHRPGRRDQPHAAQDPGGAAAVDAGVPRDGGRPDLRAAAAVPRVRDAEPDRAGGHLPAARGAARPLHVPGRRRLPDGRGGGAHRQPDDDRATARRCARCSRPSGSSSCRSWCGACRWRRTWSSTRSRSAAPTRPTEPTAPDVRARSTCRGARGRARRSTWSWPPRRARSSTAASRSSIEDVARAGARRCCVHRVLPNFHAEADGLTRARAGRAAASTRSVRNGRPSGDQTKPRAPPAAGARIRRTSRASGR